MRHVVQILSLAVSVSFLQIGCATIGPPQPPSLDLPQPPSDLRASRKGDRVTLTWTIPNLTTDRGTIRNRGPALICRALQEMNACNTPVGEVPAPAGQTTNSSGRQAQASYVDSLPPEIETDDP